MATKQEIKERRLERMRLGQAVCDFVKLPSDDQLRLCIVPLMEAEYRQVLEKVAVISAPDNLAGMQLRDRTQAQEICVRAIRDESDLSRRLFDTVEEMMEDLEQVDIDQVIDQYNEMVERSSPSLDGIPDEELEHLKKVLQEMDWNALSGRAWYAAKRFLSEISPQLLQANLLGSTSIKSSITKSD